MVQDYPLGVGMRNFGALYATYDTLGGVFGKRRDVHSSHFQVLVEQGYLGAAVWIWMFGYSLALSLRIRKRARTPGLPKAEATLIETLPLAMIVSMAGFVVGGGTVSMALNDLTWLTFALLASLDRVSAARCAEALGNGRALPAERRFQPQLAGSAPSKGLIPGV
jgi:O-antigen ligase